MEIERASLRFERSTPARGDAGVSEGLSPFLYSSLFPKIFGHYFAEIL